MHMNENELILEKKILPLNNICVKDLSLQLKVKERSQKKKYMKQFDYNLTLYY